MRRHELEHVIRAACAIADVDDIVVVGSQAILGQFPDAPAELTKSNEADVYPKDAPDKAHLIDGAIGEKSIFEETFGYYAHGVAPNTAILPRGALERLIPVRNENTAGATGWCLEIHDLAVSKLVAGREKDLEFIHALVREKMADATTIRRRLDETEVDSERLEMARLRLDRIRIL
jgi:hypothetical protein